MPKAIRESDQSIVLRDGRAVHMGKGLAEIRNSKRKHTLDMKGRVTCANLNMRDSKRL
jgi:hypothetical protein